MPLGTDTVSVWKQIGDAKPTLYLQVGHYVTAILINNQVHLRNVLYVHELDFFIQALRQPMLYDMINRLGPCTTPELTIGTDTQMPEAGEEDSPASIPPIDFKKNNRDRCLHIVCDNFDVDMGYIYNSVARETKRKIIIGTITYLLNKYLYSGNAPKRSQGNAPGQQSIADYLHKDKAIVSRALTYLKVKLRQYDNAPEELTGEEKTYMDVFKKCETEYIHVITVQQHDIREERSLIKSDAVREYILPAAAGQANKRRYTDKRNINQAIHIICRHFDTTRAYIENSTGKAVRRKYILGSIGILFDKYLDMRCCAVAVYLRKNAAVLYYPTSNIKKELANTKPAPTPEETELINMYHAAQQEFEQVFGVSKIVNRKS